MCWQSNGILNELRLWSIKSDSSDQADNAWLRQFAWQPPGVFTGPHRNPLNLSMPAFAPKTVGRLHCCVSPPLVIKLHSTGGGGRLILQSSAVTMGQSAAACCRLPLATWAWCLLHGRGRHWHLQMGAEGERRKRLSHPQPFKSPPEIKEPPVTSLKSVSDQGRISALHFLSGMKQDDCYCGTLLQLFIVWLQSSHFYLKKEKVHFYTAWS